MIMRVRVCHQGESPSVMCLDVCGRKGLFLFNVEISPFNAWPSYMYDDKQFFGQFYGGIVTPSDPPKIHSNIPESTLD